MTTTKETTMATYSVLLDPARFPLLSMVPVLTASPLQGTRIPLDPPVEAVRLTPPTDTYGAHGWGLAVKRSKVAGTLGHPQGWGLTVQAAK
jgi:hypothetical protein